MKKHLIILLISMLCTVAFGVTVTQNISLTSFNAGELSPLMQSRIDFAKYVTGAKTLENMLVRAQGPVQRRPGTKYIATVKDSTDETRLFSFEYSTDDAYIIEAGDEYFRFYRDGAQIQSEGSAYEIVSPYDCNDIFEVQFDQDSQYMRMVHPDYPPYKLTRSAHAAWTMTEIDFKSGPFLDENDNTASTISYSIATDDYTIATSGDSYKTGDDGEGLEYARKWAAQTFTTTSAYNVAGVSLKISRLGSPGLMTVSIQGVDGDSLPDGIDLCSGVIDADDFLTTPGQFENIYFTNFAYLADATMYAIVIRATNGNSSNAIQWRVDASSPTYATGNWMLSIDSGSTWSSSATGDNMFDILSTSSSDTGGIDPNVTLNSSEEIFDEDHVGALWEITHEVKGETISGSFSVNTADTYSQTIEITEDRTYRLSTAGYWVGTIEIQRSSDNGTTWEPVESFYYNLNGNVQYSGVEDDYDVALYRLAWIKDASPGAGDYCYYNFTALGYTNRGIVEIASYSDSNTVTATTDSNFPLANTTEATYKWSEGAWSTYRGFPRTISYHEQRCVYGGSTSYPQAIWASVISSQDSDYDDFDEGEGNDDDAWTYVLPGMNPVQWLVSQEYLMVGTSGGIGRLGMQDKPISPTFPPTYRTQAKNGAAYIQAVGAVDAILYVERGSEKVREITYTYSSDRFIAPDMTILAEHITGDGITSIAFQNRPDPILWCIREDGALLSFTYHRKHDVMAWTENDTGASGEFESVAQIPGSNEDEVWFVVKRTIDSNDLRYIEQLQPFDWGDDSNDCYFVDAGIDDIDDLSHLEGETVSLFADGRPIGNYTVSSGSISPASSYTNYTVGLPYTSVFETLPLVTGTNYGSSMNKMTTVKSLTVDFLETLGVHIGVSEAMAADIKFSYDDFATTIDPVTEVKEIPFAGGQARNPTIYMYEASPVPLTVRNIVATVEIVYE